MGSPGVQGSVDVPHDAEDLKGQPVTEALSSFEDFFEGTHQRLFGAICLVTGSRYEAEEIVQEAYLRIWERWARVGGLDDPVGFLFRTALNVFRSRRRRALLALRRAASMAPDTDDR
jgi:RNA polymerase sigma-70 factor (ECF subfamily)